MISRPLLLKITRFLVFASFILGLSDLNKAHAQDKPYFVTYSQDMEEPGNLEIESKSAIGTPRGGHQFGALAGELSTVRRRGGRLNSISMVKGRAANQQSLRASAVKPACVC